MTNSSARAQLARYNIPQSTLCALASSQGSRVYPSDVTRWLDGIPGVSEDKVRRLGEWLEKVIDLLTAPNSEYPNLSDPASVKSSITKLARLREEEEQARKKPIVFATFRPATSGEAQGTASDELFTKIVQGETV